MKTKDLNQIMSVLYLGLGYGFVYLWSSWTCLLYTSSGIPENLRERVFEPFFRVDKSLSLIHILLGGIDNQDNYDALMKQIQSVIDADSSTK